METLINLRNQERVVVIKDLVDDKAAFVTVELQKREGGAILVFENYSDEIVELALNTIDPLDSGYIFFASEILLDPINNIMVPNHRLATDKEIDNLTSRHIPLEKLPVLRMLDPVRRWHNFKQGSIIAVDRKDETYFRLVN